MTCAALYGGTPCESLRPHVRSVVLSIALAIVFASSPRAAQAPASALRHLQGIDELKSWFNAGNRHPRLIFLLSPT